MKKYFYSLIVVIACSFIFQACVAQQLEVNPGFGKKVPSEAPTPKVPVTKLAEGLQAKKPIWKVGYNWEYEWKNLGTGTSGTITRKIIREEAFNGIPCFVFKVGRNEDFWTKDVLGILARKRGGKIITKRDAPFQAFAWPLKVGRQWRNVYTVEKPQKESSSDRDNRVVVTRLEEVTVPAGKFKTFKIEIYSSYSGELLSERWYSPKVKFYVKYINYGSSRRERELISFNVD